MPTDKFDFDNPDAYQPHVTIGDPDIKQPDFNFDNPEQGVTDASESEQESSPYDYESAEANDTNQGSTLQTILKGLGIPESAFGTLLELQGGYPGQVPYEAGKGAAQGAMNVAGGVGEAATNAYDFLTGQQHQFPTEYFTSNQPQTGPEQLGSMASQSLLTALMTGGMGGFGGGLARLAGTSGAAGALTTPGSLMERGYQGVQDAALGAGLGYLGGFKSPKKPNTKKAQLKQVQSKIDDLQRSVENKEMSMEDARKELANYSNNQLEDIKDQSDSTEMDIRRQLPNMPKSKAKKELSNIINDERKRIKSEMNQAYNDFNTESGQKPIEEPLTKEEYNAISDLSDKQITEDKASELVPKLVQLSIENPETGMPFEIEVPPKKDGKVGDFINLHRQLRDASHVAGQKSQGAETFAEKQKYHQQKQKLARIAEKIKQRAMNPLDPAERHQFEQIQERYRKHAIPFKEEPALYKAWAQGEVSDNLFNRMQQPRNQALHEHMSQKHPHYKKRLLQHELSGGKYPLNAKDLQGQAKNIENVMQNDDLRELMPEDLKSAKSQHQDLAQQHGMMKDLLQQTKSGNFDEFINRLNRDELKGYSTEVKDLLDEAEQYGADIKKLKRQLDRHQITKDDLEKEVNQRKLWSRAIGLGALYEGAEHVGPWLYQKGRGLLDDNDDYRGRK